MIQNVTVEIVSIGTEILLGELTDTNSVFISRTLRDLGVNIYFMTSVGDNEERIASALKIALSRADIVITCGGLGPTIDDMTRSSVALATDRGLTFHQNLLDQIAERFKGFNVKMTDNNRRQAYLPDNAIVIENPVGTAPSFVVEQGDKAVISLPGVPREMKFLMTENVVPYLQQKYQLGIIKARTLKTAGIGESALDDLLGSDLLENSNPSIGLAAHSGQIDVRITAKADSEKVADELIKHTELLVRERANKFIFGAENDELDQVLADLIVNLNRKISIAEAGTEDVLISELSALLPEQALKAFIVKAPDDLYAHYDIPTETNWRDMANAISAQILTNDIDVAIVIISNPEIDEGSDHEENTVITVQSRNNSRQRVYGFGSQSELVKQWVRSWSMSAIWQMLRESMSND